MKLLIIILLLFAGCSSELLIDKSIEKLSEEPSGVVVEDDSFRKYIDNPMDYHNEVINVTGLLGSKIVDEVSYKFVRDESGNDIILTKVDPKYFFPKEGLSDRIYLVEGIFKKGQKITSIDVLDISYAR